MKYTYELVFESTQLNWFSRKLLLITFGLVQRICNLSPQQSDVTLLWKTDSSK